MHALIQNCTDVNNFIYHCVINHYGNATLEVCAPKKTIHGFCTAFNVDSGAIQNHYSAPCNQSAFPKCENIYVSSNAYKYSDCYQLVYNQRLNKTTSINVSLDHTTSSPHWDMQLIVVAYAAACCIASFLAVVFIHKTTTSVDQHFFKKNSYEGDLRLCTEKEEHIQFTIWNEGLILEEVACESDSYFFTEKQENNQAMTSDDDDFSNEGSCKSDSLLWAEKLGHHQVVTMASDDEYFAKEDACESDLFTENEENTHSMWIGGKLKLFFYIMTT